MDQGTIDIGKHGTITYAGEAIQAFRAHQLWVAMRWWQRGFRDRTISGLTKAQALRLAGEFTGKTYVAKDLDDATDDLGRKWPQLLAAATIVHSD